MNPTPPANSAHEISPSERQFIASLFRRGFLIRVAVALLVTWTGLCANLAPDEDTYRQDGVSISQYWSGQSFFKPWRFSTNQPLAYFYINGVVFYLFGESQLLLRLLNALLGAFCCRYPYFLARELYGEDAARRAATLYTYFPSLILWSALNIRDIWVVALILFISWKSSQVLHGRSSTALPGLLAGIFVLTFFRDYLFYVVALPPLIALLIGNRGHMARNFIMAVVAAIGVLYFVQQGAGSKAEHHMSLEVLSESRRNLATGGSAFGGDVDISTPGKALVFLPVGIAYFLFSPFPWQITSLLKLMSLPEMIVVYSLTPAMLRGIGYSIRHRLRESIQILMVTALLTVSYSLGEGNVGTLYRHRAQAITFYLLFAAAGQHKRSRETALAA